MGAAELIESVEGGTPAAAAVAEAVRGFQAKAILPVPENVYSATIGADPEGYMKFTVVPAPGWKGDFNKFSVEIRKAIKQTRVLDAIQDFFVRFAGGGLTLMALFSNEKAARQATSDLFKEKGEPLLSAAVKAIVVITPDSLR